MLIGSCSEMKLPHFTINAVSWCSWAWCSAPSYGFADADSNAVAIDTMWTIMFAAVLVFLMQAGFAMLETGLHPRQERRQHHDEEPDGLLHRHRWRSGPIGFGVMFGADARRACSGLDKFFLGGASGANAGVFRHRFDLCLLDLPGDVRRHSRHHRLRIAVAERTQLSRRTWCTRVFMTAQLSTRWWATGSGAVAGSSNLGPCFADFAGSTVVHSVGGWAGPGRGDRTGRPRSAST